MNLRELLVLMVGLIVVPASCGSAQETTILSVTWEHLNPPSPGAVSGVQPEEPLLPLGTAGLIDSFNRTMEGNHQNFDLLGIIDGTSNVIVGISVRAKFVESGLEHG